MLSSDQHVFWKRKYKKGFTLFAVDRDFEFIFRWDAISKMWHHSRPFASPGLANKDTMIDEQQLAELKLQLAMETHLT